MPVNHFIAAPFGNFIKRADAISVTGTWTVQPRPGRFLQILRTLRYTKQGWRNKLGLRNPGIEHALKKHNSNDVLSVASLDTDDWQRLHDVVPVHDNVEINISCPNVDHNPDIMNGIHLWCKHSRPWCIVKLPPTVENKFIDILVDLGYNQIHASNTMPTSKGGLSGSVLISHTLRIIQYIKTVHPHVTVIAGGGVNNVETKQIYLDAGADHISLGTVCFTPWRIKKIIGDINDRK
jgi:dihydroorotate dehydrogenase